MRFRRKSVVIRSVVLAIRCLPSGTHAFARRVRRARGTSTIQGGPVVRHEPHLLASLECSPPTRGIAAPLARSPTPGAERVEPRFGLKRDQSGTAGLCMANRGHRGRRAQPRNEIHAIIDQFDTFGCRKPGPKELGFVAKAVETQHIWVAPYGALQLRWQGLPSRKSRHGTSFSRPCP